MSGCLCLKRFRHCNLSVCIQLVWSLVCLYVMHTGICHFEILKVNHSNNLLAFLLHLSLSLPDSHLHIVALCFVLREKQDSRLKDLKKIDSVLKTPKCIGFSLTVLKILKNGQHGNIGKVATNNKRLDQYGGKSGGLSHQHKTFQKHYILSLRGLQNSCLITTWPTSPEPRQQKGHLSVYISKWAHLIDDKHFLICWLILMVKLIVFIKHNENI